MCTLHNEPAKTASCTDHERYDETKKEIDVVGFRSTAGLSTRLMTGVFLTSVMRAVQTIVPAPYDALSHLHDLLKPIALKGVR